MKLFLVTHQNDSKLYVAAQDFKRVTECYEPKVIEAVCDKIIMLRDRDGFDAYEDVEWQKADSRFPPKENESVCEYIQRLGRMIVNLECSNRGYQSVFEGLNKDKNEKVCDATQA